MSVTVHHQSDEPGVMVDFTWDEQRFFFISDDVSDCGQSKLWRYVSGACRCAACRALWAGHKRERRRIRKQKRSSDA